MQTFPIVHVMVTDDNIHHDSSLDDLCDKLLSEQLQDRCVDVGADIEKITCLNDGLDVVLVDVFEEVRIESEKVFMELF